MGLQRQRLCSVWNNGIAESSHIRMEKGTQRLYSLFFLASHPNHSPSNITTSRWSCCRGWSGLALPPLLLPFFTNCTAGVAPAARNWLWNCSRSTSDSPGFGLDSIVTLQLLPQCDFPALLQCDTLSFTPKSNKEDGLSVVEPWFFLSCIKKTSFSLGSCQLISPHFIPYCHFLPGVISLATIFTANLSCLQPVNDKNSGKTEGELRKMASGARQISESYQRMVILYQPGENVPETWTKTPEFLKTLGCKRLIYKNHLHFYVLTKNE